MKSFIGFITEQPQHYKTVRDYMFHGANYIPLTSRLTKKLLGKQIKTAYHVCDLLNFETLAAKQHSRTTVSATLDPGYMLPDGGESQPYSHHAGCQIIAKIEGELCLHTPCDAGTGPDSAGRRWVTIGNLQAMYSGAENAVRDTDLHGQLKDLAKQVDQLRIEIATEALGHAPDQQAGWWPAFGQNLGAKRLAVARQYFQRLYRLVEHHSDALLKAITRGQTEPETSEYDEVVLSNYRVVAAAVYEKIKPQYETKFGDKFPVQFSDLSYKAIEKFTGEPINKETRYPEQRDW